MTRSGEDRAGLFPLAGGVRQRSGQFSGWLGRSLAQAEVAGNRGRGQSPGDFERSTLGIKNSTGCEVGS
jgi:hypothetical protein